MNPSNRSHNYYNELGISSSSTQEEIKEAYRILAREFHPDINPSENARIRFSNIQKAYHVLSDANQRAEYDMQRGILSEEGEEGFLTSSKKIRRELSFAPEKEATVFINRHANPVSGFAETLKSIMPAQLTNKSLFKKELVRNVKKESSIPEKERVYHFSVDEIEALTGSTRSIVLNVEGTQIRRDIPIPPLDKSEKKLKIRLPRLNGKIGFDEIKIIVKVTANPNFTRKGCDIYLTVPMLRSELEQARSMTVATTEGFETITLNTSHLKSPLILSSGGLWDRERNLHGDIIICVTEVNANGDKKKEEEYKTERERILFLLASLKKQSL